jgi:hypothetical protein
MRHEISPGIFTIDGVLSPDECRQYIDWSERVRYDAATVSLAGGAVDRPDIRNTARAILAWPETAAELWRRVAGAQWD